MERHARTSALGIARSSLAVCLLLAMTSCGSGSGGTPPSSNADLGALVLSAGALSPVFDASTTGYTVGVGSAVTSTTVTPTASDGAASITVNGVAVASGTASGAISLAVLPTNVTVIVTAQDGATVQTYTVVVTRFSSLDFVDPTPSAGDRFGTHVVVLGNGNVVVTDPSDSSVVSSGGAVHLYSPLSATPIASIYGDVANDSLGSGGVTALPNNNFVVASPFDDEGGIVDAGSVRLVSGTTGAQIGATLAGDMAGDSLGGVDLFFGLVSGVTALPNNNFVVVSLVDDEGGIVDAGSVRLVSGTTGAQIGATLAGDMAGDALGVAALGDSGVTALPNNNFVVASPFDDEGGIVDAGSVRLVSGTTGAQIGPALAGDVAGDRLGSLGVTALPNNNFVVATLFDNEGGIVNAGSVRLVSGTTGLQIGATLAGDVAGDKLGSSGVAALPNSNFAVASMDDSEGGILRCGSARLVSGTTGAQIGPTLAGDGVQDLLGQGGVTALSNNNFVVASPNDNDGGLVGAGSVRLVSGTTGLQIGPALTGEVTNDVLGTEGATALPNGNFVVASVLDDEGGIVDAGSVRLVSGTTGLQIGATLAGDVAGDGIGGDGSGDSGVTALPNNNFVVVSPRDEEGGVGFAGSVRLVSGTTGAQIGATLAGDVAGDALGSAGVTALPNNNFVVVSPGDDEGGIVDAGSVRLVSGTTGAQIGATLAGDVANDVIFGLSVAVSPTGVFFVTAFPDWDSVAGVDSGRVRLIAD